MRVKKAEAEALVPLWRRLSGRYLLVDYGNPPGPARYYGPKKMPTCRPYRTSSDRGWHPHHWDGGLACTRCPTWRWGNIPDKALHTPTRMNIGGGYRVPKS